MKKTKDAIIERMVSAIKFQKRSRYEHEKKKKKKGETKIGQVSNDPFRIDHLNDRTNKRSASDQKVRIYSTLQSMSFTLRSTFVLTESLCFDGQ